MPKINWKVRLKSRAFVTSLISILLVLANQIAGAFGADISFISQEITTISETVLMILAMFGIVHDPTTKGASDSELVLKK